MVNSDLNYKHLRYFWTVARVGTIAEAGRVLGLAPHSISAQLATFEGALGVTLFRRSGRRLALTEAGERILGQAEEIFALGDQIVETLRDDSLRRSLPRPRPAPPRPAPLGRATARTRRARTAR